MADAKVEIQINAKDSASSVFKKVGGAAADLGKTMALGIAAGGAAVAAGIGAAVKVAADFEKQMSAVQAVSGATGEEMAALSGKALQLGKDTSFSASEAAAGLEELVKGGVPIGDIMNGAAEATLALAEAGGVDLASAAEIASAAINTFNLSGQDMGHVADLIAGAANNSAIDVNDFRLSTAAAGAAVALAGGSFDDMAIAITAMGQAGIKGSDAGTSLKTMLLNLQPTTKAQTTLFKELGLVTADGSNKFFDAQGKLKSFAEVAGTLQNALKGQTDQQKLATLETIFGSDAIRAASVFAEQGSEGFEKLGEAIGRQGSAAEAGRVRLDNLAGDVTKLGGSVEVAAIKLGQAFQPAMRAAVQAIDAFIGETLIPFAEEIGPPLAAAAVRAGEEAVKIGESIRDNVSTGLEGFRAKLAEVGTDLAQWTSEHGEIGSAVSHSLNAVSGAALALQLLLQGNWKGAMTEAAASIGEVELAAGDAAKATEKFRLEMEKLPATQTAIADLGNAWATAGRALENFGAVLGPMVGNLGGAGAAAGDAAERTDFFSGFVRGMLSPVTEATKNLEMFSLALRFVGDRMNEIGPLFDAIGTATKTLETNFNNAMTGLRDGAATAMAGVTQAIADELGRMRDTGAARIGGFVERTTAQLGEMSSGAQAAMAEFVNSIVEGVGNTASAAGAAVDGMVQGVVAQLDGMSSGAASAMGAFVASVGQGLADANTAALTAVAEFANIIIGGITALSGQAYSAAAGVGSSIAAGVTGGITAAAGGVAAAASAMVTNALNAARAAIGAQSPSTAFMEVGDDAVAGLVVGLEEATPDAELAAGDLGTSATEAAVLAIETAIEEVGPQVEQAAYNLGESVAEAIGAGLGKKEMLQAGVDALKGTVAGAMRDVADAVDELVAETERKFEEIGQKTAAAFSSAIATAADQLEDIIADTARAIDELETNLIRGREARAAREGLTGGLEREARERDRGREDQDVARDRAREDAKFERQLARDLANAKTTEEKVAILQRAQEARDEMLERRREEDEDRAYRRKRQDEDRQFAQEQAKKVRQFEDQQEQDALNRSILRAVQERNARVAELTKTLDEKQAKITADHNTEIAKFSEASQRRIAILRDEFLAKLPSLTNGAVAIINNFADRINLALQRVARQAQDTARAIAALDDNIGNGGGEEHVPEFALGGVVPGRIGAPMLAKVHGGETILPASGGAGYAPAQPGPPPTVINLTLYGTVLTPTDLVDAIHNGLLAKKRGLGTLGLS